MDTLKFKTDIKCAGCIAKVTPHLNEVIGENNWNVDIADPAKVLSVPSTVEESKVKEAITKAGYRLEKI